MIRGYRWVETGRGTWLFEGPSGSRRFHGVVSDYGDGYVTFCLPGGYHVSYGDGRTEEHGCGQHPTVRAAKDEVEKAVREKAQGVKT